jgi:anti-sigma B factor antagonist
MPPMSSSLTCMEKRRLAALMISWDGQLQQLIEVGTSKLLINLTDVTQLDSSSIGSIVRAFVSLKHRGASLKLLRPRGNVRLVLETVHLMDVIPTIEDETQAIASFH